MSIIIGIDASRCKSGGAIAHIKGILNNFVISNHEIKEVHIWSYKSLLDSIPDFNWLIKHYDAALDKSLIHQILWQLLLLKGELKKNKCNILFSADASTLCGFRPNVVLSQDLLSYEPGVIEKFGGLKRIRLIVIYYLQNFAFKRADGVIFLTKYTSDLIQKHTGILNRFIVIPHGVNSIFSNILLKPLEDFHSKELIDCLYISNVEAYKNHENVLRAVSHLRKNGFRIKLTFVGGGQGKAMNSLKEVIKIHDPNFEFLSIFDFVENSDLPNFLQKADIFIFASSCETWGITLLEAMAAGMPIVCSYKSSLPEVLADSGIYFNPEDFISIADSIKILIDDENLRENLKKRAKFQSAMYNWKRCSDETFSFISNCFYTLK